MNRISILIASLALSVALSVAAVACGSDKAAESDRGGEDSPKATATRPPRTATPKPEATATERAETTSDEGDGSAASGVFNTLFGSALSSGLAQDPAALGFGEGDPALLALLPGESDFPPGFTSQGEFTMHVPAGVSETGAADMAMRMAGSGNPDADPANAAMLMVMVMRFEDLQDLQEAFGEFDSFSEDDLKDSFEQGGGPGFDLTNVRVLDAGGLGENGAGMEITIDMSELFGTIGDLGGEGAPAELEGLGVMTMRMYFFGRGEYMGAVMRMGFSDELTGEAEDRALAEVLDGNLE